MARPGPFPRAFEEHLLPDFEDRALAGILRADVDRWEKKEKAAYAASSVKTWRSTLHLILADALEDGLITSNPAAKWRGRGKRAGRSRDRGPEKVITEGAHAARSAAKGRSANSPPYPR